MHQEEMGRGWGAGAQLIGILACVSLQGPGGGAAEVLSGLWAMLGVVTGRPSGPAEPSEEHRWAWAAHRWGAWRLRGGFDWA